VFFVPTLNESNIWCWQFEWIWQLCQLSAIFKEKLQLENETISQYV